MTALERLQQRRALVGALSEGVPSPSTGFTTAAQASADTPSESALFTAGERWALLRLVHQAYDLRDTPYLRDGCEAIVEWWQKVELRRLDEEDRKTWAAIRLLRRVV